MSNYDSGLNTFVARMKETLELIVKLVIRIHLKLFFLLHGEHTRLQHSNDCIL